MSEPAEPTRRELPPPAETPPRGGNHLYRSSRRGRGGLWLPIALIVFGVIALLDQFGLLWWMRWEVLWPLVLIALGVVLIFRRRR